MKGKQRKKEESGQMLVLLTVGLVVFLGLAALAIDGGLVYADRRYDQNVADAAAYAGGGAAAMEMENAYITGGNFSCGNTSVMNAVRNAAITEAMSRAGNNGFTIDQNLDDKSGVEVICEIPLKNGIPDPYLDVHVQVTSDVSTAFAHLFYGGKIGNTVESVVRVRPRSNLAAGYAIIATDRVSSKAVWAHGTPDTYVNGGGILSNAGMTGNGSFTVTVSPHTLPINYVTGSAPTGTWSPAPHKIQESIVVTDITSPDSQCDGLTNRNTSGSTWQPGQYGSVTVNAQDDITLQPGLYCFDSLHVNGQAAFRGTGVTIYMRGDLTINGGADINLAAPTGEVSPAIRNVVIYCAPDTDVQLNGNSGSSYTGTIYCPQSDLVLTGTGDVNPTYHTQIIGKTVEFGGTASLRINYNPDENYTRPTYLELNK